MTVTLLGALAALTTAVGGVLGAWWTRRKVLAEAVKTVAEADLTSVEAAERVNTILVSNVEAMIARLVSTETRAVELETALAKAHAEISRLSESLSRAESDVLRLSEMVERLNTKLAAAEG